MYQIKWKLIAVCGLLLAVIVHGAVPVDDVHPSACGAQPKPLNGFNQNITACWTDAALPAAALGYNNSNKQSAIVAAASWVEVQKLVTTATTALHISLTGMYVAESVLRIDDRIGVVLSGPARITCSGGLHPAIIVSRSSAVTLQSLTIEDCSDSGVLINATASGKPFPITSYVEGYRRPPDVVLQDVTIRNCSSSSRGAGVKICNSRVVLQDCSFQDNTADGCGGGVYANKSALLVIGTRFHNNSGNNTAADDWCRGGALQAQNSWLAITNSTFSGNRGVNGSAVLLIMPVGVAQLHNSVFVDNHERPGVGDTFFASSGAVTVVGEEWRPVPLVRGQSTQECTPITQGMAVVGCKFLNNTAAVTGGEGGALSSYGSFLAVINTTLIGAASTATTGTASKEIAGINTSTGTADVAAAAHFQGVQFDADLGGCLRLRTSGLYLYGSLLSQCRGRSVGGGLGMLDVTAVIQDTTFANNTADMGGGLGLVDGYIWLSNISVLHNHGLNAAAGIYLESTTELHAHVEHADVHHNRLTGRGGGILAEMQVEAAKFVLSIYNSRFTHNVARYGGGMALYSIKEFDFRNNYVAHNTALNIGGGVHCAWFIFANQTFGSVNNTWLNNTAFVHGGAIMINPCNITSSGDMFLANRALQDGGALMVMGGQDIKLQNVQLSCNTAHHGGAIMVKRSIDGEASHVELSCSNVTINGIAHDPRSQAACMYAALPAIKHRSVAASSVAAAAAAAAGTSSTSRSTVADVAAAAADKGGGVYVSVEQSAVLFSSSIDSNIASSSGGGVFLDRGARLQVQGARGSVSGNNCTGGPGGGVFIEDGAVLTATDTAWRSNHGMFGGGIFAFGKDTSIKLRGVELSNNTAAAAGGAVATFGGSSVKCSGGCSFKYNRAKVGGALILHSGTATITQSIFLANAAAATTASAGHSTAVETLQYMLGKVYVTAGGAAYVWRGHLKLQNCTLARNVAWGPAGRGGGVFADDAELYLADTDLSDNWATAAGGAVLLGPAGQHQLLDVQGGSFSGNAAGAFGGAVAGGMLLPSDAAEAAATSAPGAASNSSRLWTVQMNRTRLDSNTAGRQGGAIACNMCHHVLLQNVELQGNAAAQTGGGISCVLCSRVVLANTTLELNTAASGGGGCILAAGAGSAVRNSSFAGNTAGTAAANVSAMRLNAAIAAAAAVLSGDSVANGTASILAVSNQSLPTVQQALPACGVVGTGGGLCLGLWQSGFLLQGPGTFANNMALFGAGMLIEACSGGPEVCPLTLVADSILFSHNMLSTTLKGAAVSDQLGRHLHYDQADAAALVQHHIGSGADVYLTNASVLVPGNKAATTSLQQQHQQRSAAGSSRAAAAGGSKQQPDEHAAASPQAGDRRLHGLQMDVTTSRSKATHIAISSAGVDRSSHYSSNSTLQLLAVAQHSAAAAAQAGQTAAAGSAKLVAHNVATGPARLGAVLAKGPSAGDLSAASSLRSSAAEGTVASKGRIPRLSVHVLDQLGGQVDDDVADHVSVQVSADFGDCSACQLSGISRVLPVNGTAHFDQLQMLAQPGTDYNLTLKLLSALDGIELAAGAQSVRVHLPRCHWGQATKAVGCYNCTSPLFTFTPIAGKCSLCPQNAAYCSSTTLLPGEGYWHSGPLSTRMHKCPRRNACLRGPDATMTMRCLQQQQLILRNPGFATEDRTGSIIGGSSNSSSIQNSGHHTTWNSLRQQCNPILQLWAAKAAADANSSGQRHLLQANSSSAAHNLLWSFLNSTAAVEDAYMSLLCAQGYQGRLCSECVFPGSAADAPYGRFYTGCGKCPSLRTAVATYVLSRAFDVCIVGLLILATLREMKKRRAAVAQARKLAMQRLAASMALAAASTFRANKPSTQVSRNAVSATSLSAAAAAVGAAENASANRMFAAKQSTGDGPDHGGVRAGPDHGGAFAKRRSLLLPVREPYSGTPLLPGSGSGQLQQQRSDTLQAVNPATAGVRQDAAQMRQMLAGKADIRPHRHLPASGVHLLVEITELEADESPARDQHRTRNQQQPEIETTTWSDGDSGVMQFAPASAAVKLEAGHTHGVSGGNAAAAPLPANTAAASGPAGRLRQRRPRRRGPLFAFEGIYRSTANITCYLPGQLTTVELFEVLKDFLQLLAILQVVFLGWQSTAALVLSSVSITPMSTKAWISLDCILPRTQHTADMRPFYQIAAAILEPVLYAVLMLLVWFGIAASLSLRTRQPYWRVIISRKLKAPIVCSLLVLLSYFYPSLAYTVLGVFSCRYLDPAGGNLIPGEALSAQGWYWTADYNRQCFVDPGHRAIALGLGIPGALLLLAYPLLQAIILARKADAGYLTPTSEFFADYGHLVEDFRPRLFYWGSVVELRKLVLVALVLGLASIGQMSQLIACSVVIGGYCTAIMGLLPYPYVLLNRLHLGCAGVLLAVLWLNLFVALGEEGGLLSEGISAQQSLVLQLLSVVIVIVMTLLLLCMCTIRLYRSLRGILDVDGDGRISWVDLRAVFAGVVARSRVRRMPKSLSIVLKRKRSSKGSATAT